MQKSSAFEVQFINGSGVKQVRNDSESGLIYSYKVQQVQAQTQCCAKAMLSSGCENSDQDRYVQSRRPSTNAVSLDANNTFSMQNTKRERGRDTGVKLIPDATSTISRRYHVQILPSSPMSRRRWLWWCLLRLRKGESRRKHRHSV